MSKLTSYCREHKIKDYGLIFERLRQSGDIEISFNVIHHPKDGNSSKWLREVCFIDKPRGAINFWLHKAGFVPRCYKTKRSAMNAGKMQIEYYMNKNGNT